MYLVLYHFISAELQANSHGTGKDSLCGWHPKQGSQLRNAPPLLAARGWGTSLGTTGSRFSRVSLLLRGRELSHHTEICAYFKADMQKKAPFSGGEFDLDTYSKDTAYLPAVGTSSSPTTLCNSKGRIRHLPRLSVCFSWRKTQSITATRATGCCEAADGAGCVPWRISPWGLGWGVLAHAQVYVRGIRSDAAWYEFSFFYKQLFDRKTAQRKTRANSSALMQSNINTHAKLLVVFYLLGALCEISPGIGNYPGNQGSETIFANDLTAYLQLYINSFSWSQLKNFRWVESQKELQRLGKKQLRYLREKFMTAMKESTVLGRTWVKNWLCTIKTLAWAYSYGHTLVMFHSSNVKRKSCC